jgi:hypothetical protein
VEPAARQKYARQLSVSRRPVKRPLVKLNCRVVARSVIYESATSLCESDADATRMKGAAGRGVRQARNAEGRAYKLQELNLLLRVHRQLPPR